MSWCLPAEDLTLDVIWAKHVDFSSPSVSCQVPTRKCKYLAQRYIPFFFLKDEELVSKTINDSNIHLEKFPATKVRQLAKKMESSKSTTRHIKEVANDPQAAQVNLLRHQRTDLPTGKSKWKQISIRPGQKVRRGTQVNSRNEGPPYKK